MVHNHGHAHLARRQDDEDVETIVSVRIVTAQNTYTGKVIWVTQTQNNNAPKTLVAPAVRPMPSTTVGGSASQSVKPSSSASRATPSQLNDDGGDQNSPVQSTLMMATKAPTPSMQTAAASFASATASISATATAAASEGGMSTGAKAGLVFGILVVIGALLAGVLVIYRKKQLAMMGKGDNEKIDMNNAPAPPPPQVQSAPGIVVAPVAAPSIRTERTLSTAPRLSLRPVTQFDPAFENRKSAGNLLSVTAAAAVAPAARSQEKDLPNRPSSAWERPGAANAPAENPFNDPQHSSPQAANPFGNDAALDASQARIPDSPPNASPLAVTHPGSDFANPAPAIAAAELAAGAALTKVTSHKEEFPAPPSIKAPSDGVPASPAWTEDFPASPGPAPVGPPPVAGAMVGPRSNSPAPPPNNVHRVQLDFKPSMQDELELNAGQLVRMLHEYDDGWALCIRMDRSQQGVVPRTCLSKHPVKPRTGPPRQGPPPPGMRGPPIRSPMGPGGVPQPRPLTPTSGRNSPGPRAMSPGPQYMQGNPRARSNSNAPYAGPPRSMSPGPYGGGPQMPPPQMDGRPRSNSASQVGQQQRRGPAPGPSPMNPNAPPAGPMNGAVPARKPVPGMAM